MSGVGIWMRINDREDCGKLNGERGVEAGGLEVNEGY